MRACGTLGAAKTGLTVSMSITDFFIDLIDNLISLFPAGTPHSSKSASDGEPPPDGSVRHHPGVHNGDTNDTA